MFATNREWAGTFNQPDFGEYPVSLTIDDDRIEVRYPQLGCGGFLSVERIEAGVAYLRENIVYGTSNCLDGLAAQISERDGKLYFRVLLPDGSLGGEASLTPA